MAVCRSIVITAILPVLVAAGASLALAQSGSRNAPLSVEEVVQMSKEGVSEDLIVTSIKKNGKPFDLNTDEILELRKSGVSDTVIKLLLDPTQPYAPPPPPKPAEKTPGPPPPPKPAKKYPADDYAARVPAESGLFSFTQDPPAKVDIKILLGEKSGAGLGKVLLRKGKVTAYLVGSSAKMRVPEGMPVFYIRLPEGKSIEEILLVALDRKNGRRELDAGPPGPKPEIRPEALRQFDAVEVGAGLYRMNPAKLAPGEFMFYLIGSADPAKGNYGKGYDFEIGTLPGEKH